MKLFRTLTLVLSIIPFVIFAQTNDSELQHTEQQKISTYFSAHPMKLVPDTTADLAFAFKISVKKGLDGKVVITSISSNDEIAYRIFPDYDKFFRLVKYSVFLRGIKEANFIIPVALRLFGSQDRKRADADLGSLTSRLFYFSGSDIHQNIYFRPYAIAMDLKVYE